MYTVNSRPHCIDVERYGHSVLYICMLTPKYTAPARLLTSIRVCQRSLSVLVQWLTGCRLPAAIELRQNRLFVAPLTTSRSQHRLPSSALLYHSSQLQRGCSGPAAEYWARNRQSMGLTLIWSTASNLEQVANVLCTQANSASYHQRHGR